MASFLLFLSLPLLFFSPVSSSSSPSSLPDDQIPKSYIIYMGGSNVEDDESDMKVAESAHLQLLSSVIPSDEGERMSVNHVYHHSFRGFSAFLTPSEASLLS
ncbi:hypothetical protein SOVF_187980, partial [Spinacia oleracea]